jgi:hypothetical protein
MYHFWMNPSAQYEQINIWTALHFFPTWRSVLPVSAYLAYLPSWRNGKRMGVRKVLGS